MRDILNRDDIELFMKTFYERLLDDPTVSEIFDHIDLEDHLPVICDFWESVLFQKSVYFGSPFQVHRSLNLKKEHFDVWLGHFDESLDLLFVGDKARSAKARASMVASMFKSKLGIK